MQETAKSMGMPRKPAGNNKTEQIEKIFSGQKLDFTPSEPFEICFQNELFRKLLNDLNSILDLKLSKRNGPKRSPRSAKTIPRKSSGKQDFVAKQFRNQGNTLKRQSFELESLEKRVKQVENKDYYDSLVAEIEDCRQEIDQHRKDQRFEFSRMNSNGKQLKEIEEIKGQPESLQKSAMLESDLEILALKNKILRKKMEKSEDEVKNQESKAIKAESELTKLLAEASEMGISLERNPFKERFTELSLKIARFKACIEGMKNSNCKITRKSENEVNEQKKAVSELEVKIAEQQSALEKIRERLQTLSCMESIDKSLKGVLDLFTGGETDSQKSRISSKDGIRSQGNTVDLIKEEKNEGKRENSQKTQKIRKLDGEKGKNNEDIEKREVIYKNSVNEEKLMNEGKLPNDKTQGRELPKKDQFPKEDGKAQKGKEIPINGGNKKTEANPGKSPNKLQDKEEVVEELDLEPFPDDSVLQTQNYSEENPKIKPSDSLSQPLKTLSNSGSGTLTISPKTFKFLADTPSHSKKSLFCRVKSGSRSFNTKISEGLKPKWDEEINFRRSTEEKTITLQVWDFEVSQSEQMVGETIIDLTEKPIDIERKGVFSGEVEIMSNGGKKGDIWVEIRWVGDNN